MTQPSTSPFLAHQRMAGKRMTVSPPNLADPQAESDGGYGAGSAATSVETKGRLYLIGAAFGKLLRSGSANDRRCGGPGRDQGGNHAHRDPIACRLCESSME